MTDWQELQELANDYVAGRVKLSKLANWLNDRIEQWLEIPEESPEQQLRGYVQLCIYEMDDGLPEEAAKEDITRYLAEHNLLRPAASQRASS